MGDQSEIECVSLPSWLEDEPSEDFKIRRPLNPEFRVADLTPMVDLTLLMLLFYLIMSAVNLQKNLDVEHRLDFMDPYIDSRSTLISASIDAADRIYIEDEQVRGFTELRRKLRLLRGMDGITELYLRVDPESTHEKRILVMDAAATEGFRSVYSIITMDY